MCLVFKSVAANYHHEVLLVLLALLALSVLLYSFISVINITHTIDSIIRKPAVLPAFDRRMHGLGFAGKFNYLRLCTMKALPCGLVLVHSVAEIRGKQVHTVWTDNSLSLKMSSTHIK